jgi:sugar phosphate isomerase/epimerase
MRKLALSLVSLYAIDNNIYKNSIKNQLLAKYAPIWGFEYVELMIYDGRNNWENYREIKRVLNEAKIGVAAVSGGIWGGTTKEFERNVEEKKQLVEVCRFFDSEILTGTGTNRFKGGLDQCVKLLEEVLPTSEKAGVKLSLEPHIHNQLESLLDYVYILERVRHPSVGICLDTGHLYGAGVDMHALLDIYIDRVNHVHLKDASKAGGHFFVPYGEGKIDNEGLLTRLVNNNYQGFYSIELEVGSATQTGEYLQAAKQLYEKFESE